MQKICQCLFLALTATLMVGCAYIPDNKLYNNTGKDLTITMIYNQTEERTLKLQNKQSALIGVPNKIRVQIADTSWNYYGKTIPLRYHKYAERHKWIANLQIQQNGMIYLLLPDSSAPVESFPPQPEEFPLVPEK